VLRLESVTKFFGTKRALHDASLTVRSGDRVALLGENGSGKSTLLAIACGVLDADYGKVERPPSAGYAPEKPDIPDHLLVSEWLDVVASLKRARAADADTLPIRALLGRRVSALSTGQRQLVSLTAAMLGEPALLVLDEPTNGLDVDVRAAVIERLRSSTLLVATHDAALVEALGARVLRMNEGRLVHDA
jgi:ABC-2 type transport system ATP-binding protein